MHRNLLEKHIPTKHSEIRHLSAGQVLFLLTMHDMECMRSAAGLPASLVTYFVNNNLNKHLPLVTCMDSVAEKVTQSSLVNIQPVLKLFTCKVIRGSINDLNTEAAAHSLPNCLFVELQSLLLSSTHRVAKARDISAKYLNRLIASFPSLMCDASLVTAILEVLTLLERACTNEFTDEVEFIGSIKNPSLITSRTVQPNLRISF